MDKKYDFHAIEKKWQKRWLDDKVFSVVDGSSPGGKAKPKYYQLETFPYPSADGLHVGHPKGYTAEDIHARYMRMHGKEVLYTMGWDAFGLPTENYAIKIGKNPKEVAAANIKNFKRQVQMFGFSYDWDREINTSSPEYYKWTQWLFIQLYKKGLAYRAKARVNWCPSCLTVLANEQVIQKSEIRNPKSETFAGVCERCETSVEQREMEQWFFKITDYAERLLADVKNLDWPASTIKRQEDWIRRSEGALIKFEIRNPKFEIEVFTTRPDTLFGATYMVLAPEHPLVASLLEIKNPDEVKKYIEEAKHKTELQRQEETKEKTGVELKGVKAINPATKEEIPVWVADYVLGSYGTGAIMAVPAHDERDFEFAKKYDLPIKQVVVPVFGSEDKKPNAVFRETVSAFVKNKKGEVLMLKWKEYDWLTSVIGGIEKGESPAEAARREVFEETGYRARAVFTSPIAIESHFFADHKNEWRSRLDHPVLLELEDEKPEKISEEESAKHELRWMPTSEALQIEMFKNNKMALELALGHIKAYTETRFGEHTTLTQSGSFTGLSVEEAKKIMSEEFGTLKTTYKLRDWSVSRQRYWGTPIPMIHCEACGIVPVADKDLPVVLPDLENYRPKGKPPLASSEEFINVKCPQCGGEAKRAAETLDTFVDSSWYYLAYAMQGISNFQFPISNYIEAIKHWLPVDLYVIGAEHTVLHLLYSRFITKFLHDEGYLNFVEPFLKLRHQGLILGEGGKKMSKSKGNVVNPDELVDQFGADTVRLYEMFMGPFEDGAPWDSKGVLGVHRFLNRAWTLIQNANIKNQNDPLRRSASEASNAKFQNENEEIVKILHKTIKKVGEDIEGFKFNTAVSALMILLNEMENHNGLSVMSHELFIKILHPFAPHIAQELWEITGNNSILDFEPWPEYDPALIAEDTFTLVIQVNGRVRGSVEARADITEAEARSLALGQEKLESFLGGKEPKRVIYVPGRLVNIVL